MTKELAIEQLNAGRKLTHRYFFSEEFVYMVDGKTFDENDRELPDFWVVREGMDIFDDGWDIYDSLSNDPFILNF